MIEPTQNQNPTEETLALWTAPARPFKRRDKQFWVTIISIAMIVALVLFVVEGFMPVILIISLVFLFYVMNTVEPESIEYKLTSKGVKIAGQAFLWENLTSFWFTKRLDSTLMVFGMNLLPGRLEIVVPEEQKTKAKEVAGKFIPEEEIPPSSLDKVTNWLSSKLPGNS